MTYNMNYLSQFSPEERLKLSELLAMQQDNSEPSVQYDTGNQQFLSALADPQNSIRTSGFDENFMARSKAPAPLPQNFIRNERTGAVTDLGQSQPSQPALDYTMPIEMAGIGKGYRLKGDSTRAVMADGRIVDLGRDTARERAIEKENLALQNTRANIEQTNLENKIKQIALDEAAGLSTGGQMTAKQYEARHGKIPAGFEIYRTETGEADIRPVQGGKQYIDLQDRLNKFESSTKAMKEYENQITKLEKHPGRESATGFSSITNSIAFPGGDAKTFLNELETFQSQAFLSNIDKLRGTGPLSNVEGEKLQAAVGNLNPTSDEATFLKNLRYVKQKFNELKATAAKEAEQARGELKREKPKLTSVDGEAMAWAMKNPTDPRAAAIKERLGVR